MDILEFFGTEAETIDGCLRDYGAAAWVEPGSSVVGGGAYIRYAVRLGRSEKVGKVMHLADELNERLTDTRSALVRAGAIPQPTDAAGRPVPVKVHVRWLRTPLAIEVDHPMPAPLAWDPKQLDTLAPGEALVGRRWELAGPVTETWRPDQSPHPLVAGQTNSGKSTLLAAMVATLAYATPPDDMQIVIVDPKNDSFLDLAALPHVSDFAANLEDAVPLIQRTLAELERRVKVPGSWPGPGLLLVIDEVAELILNWKDGATVLGRLGAVGRSSRVHLLAGTQLPTKDVLGKITKAQFTLRLVGRVADAQDASTATGRPGSGAHLLPGRGAFLRIDEAGTQRFQAYFLGKREIRGLVREVGRKWSDRKPVALLAEHANLDALDGWSGIPLDAPAAAPSSDAAAAVLEAIEPFYVNSPTVTRSDMVALADFMAEHGPAVLAPGTYNKARLIRDAYDVGLIHSAGTGGRNSLVFQAGLEAVGAVAV